MHTTEMSTQFQSAKRKIFSSSTFIADVISRSNQFLNATVPIHKDVGGNTEEVTYGRLLETVLYIAHYTYKSTS